MGIISRIFNFEDIGTKIKNVTKWGCWISILLVWVGAIIGFLACLFTEGMLLFAFLIPFIAAAYSVAIWFGSWALYAFGEQVENTQTIQHNTNTLVFLLRNEATQAPPSANITPEAPKPAEAAPKPVEVAQPTAVTSDVPPIPKQPVEVPKAPPKKVYAEGEYVPGRTYRKGDEVIFQGIKYLCVASGSTVWSPLAAPMQWKEIDSTEVKT